LLPELLQIEAELTFIRQALAKLLYE